jgi:2-C-methyl-D-erythritol 2,4-cyclodiphosphate synthase
MRVGLGHDLHRLTRGRALKLGGVDIDYELGAEGHSDGDVLLHALTDGLLGAAALGDIGEWFSDTDPRWAGADSAQFVIAARQAVEERGYQIANVDCTIFAQRPKLSPYKPAIAARVAELLRIPVDCVNIKAKTGELVGPIGRGEALAADVIVLLESPSR